MEHEIKDIKLENTVDTCPVCNYTDGFHVSFAQENGKMNIILICPDCHFRFDPHWEIKVTK